MAQEPSSGLDRMVADIRRCRRCLVDPVGEPLPHEPRPVLQVNRTAKVCVCGQAPGTRVHASGRPFTDPSGDRLRAWMGVSDAEFYDRNKIAIVPMGFCFPGLDAKGGDRPPRKECSETWHDALFANLPDLQLVLLVGQYAQKWHLGRRAQKSLTATVAAWEDYLTASAGRGPVYFPMPHPSWRNNAWLNKNSWFEAEALPVLRVRVRALIS